MTGTIAEAAAALDKATAELEELDAFEGRWSTGARRKRREELVQAQLEAAEAEARERARLAAQVERLAAELEPLYAEGVAAMEQFVEAAEAIIAKRAGYVDAWRRAKAAGVPVGTLVPKSSIRAASERGDTLDLARRLRRASAQSDW